MSGSQKKFQRVSTCAFPSQHRPFSTFCRGLDQLIYHGATIGVRDEDLSQLMTLLAKYEAKDRRFLS